MTLEMSNIRQIVIETLSQSSPLLVQAIARKAHLSPMAMRYHLTLLERAGLIEITQVEADLRRRAVWLTEAGARRLEAAIPVWRRAQAKLARRLAPDLARRLADQAEGLLAVAD